MRCSRIYVFFVLHMIFYKIKNNVSDISHNSDNTNTNNNNISNIIEIKYLLN